ncbi:arylsulfatase [Bacteroides sp. f07]|uniref:arylsulfatase n=1 Tax=Bacteroides sp. f07 TaxID=3132704 RepID=UPI0036F3E9EC
MMNKTLVSTLLLVPVACQSENVQDNGKVPMQTPNIVYIMADDLGIGDLGCYGQQQIKTPCIDGLARNGMMFMRHYSGSSISAPSRCTLLTGKHTGHAAIRGNKPVTLADGEKYDTPLPAKEVTVAKLLKQKNYRTACIGKWGMGGPDSEGHPNRHGFDYFYGYLGQGHAHSYYPPFLFENNEKIMLEKKHYSHNLIVEKALDFIDKNAEHPFFLYFSPTIPHAELAVPEENMQQYEGQFQEKPFAGGHYCAQPKPRAAYAAMVTLLDTNVGQIIELLKRKGVYENTIIIFTSDNGVHKEGGHDPEYFNSNAGLRGIKRDFYEGGIRTPFIVEWPGMIAPGSRNQHVSAFWDFLPTVCDITGISTPHDIDGISYLPVLKGLEQPEHDYLYYEFYEKQGTQAVIQDDWKLISLQVNAPKKTHYELYNLKTDPKEQHNVAVLHPDRVEQLKALIKQAHTKNPIFNYNFE